MNCGISFHQIASERLLILWTCNRETKRHQTAFGVFKIIIFPLIYQLQFLFLCDQVLGGESFHSGLKSIDTDHLLLLHQAQHCTCNWETKCYMCMRNQTLKVRNKSLELENSPKVMGSFYNSLYCSFMLHFPPN